MKKKISIAIDGPSAAGKSTIAKKIAEICHLIYIDTGAMYRCVAYYMVSNHIDVNDENTVVNELKHINIELKDNNIVYLNNQDVSKQIRTNEISLAASKVSSYEAVRTFLVKQQQQIASHGGVILDGRDIGTVVIPDADLKIYQVADVKERAYRRYKENLEKGIETSLEEIEKQIEKRDFDDMNRKNSPLKKADDAIEVDTSNKSIDETVAEILALVKKIS